LFVLVTDSIFRALAESIGPRDIIRGYADDIGIVIRDVWEFGPRVSSLFNCVALISQLHLNGKKCVFIPLWKADAEEVATQLKYRIPAWRVFLIRFFGKYLGFFIGPGANNKEWATIMANILEQARFIKSLGLPKLQAFLLYHMIGVSQLQFVAQLRSPPRSLRRYELSAARAVIGGPGLWAPLDLFHNLQSKCKFPVALKAFDTLCASVMWKTGLSMEASWKHGIEILEQGAKHDDAYLIHPFEGWLQGCAVVKLREVCTNIQLSDVRAYVNEDLKKQSQMELQTAIYKHLLPIMHPFDLIRALSKKFTRWFSEQDAQMFAARANHLVQAVHSQVPPCVLYCLINTWFNGWCTNRRFQGSGKCLLSAQCDGEDSLEHYAVCSFHWKVFSKRLRRSCHPYSICRFFGLEADTSDDMVFHVCHIYAVRRGVDIRHRVTGGAAGSDDQVEALVWNGHRTAALYHPGLAKRYSKIWVI
jgi:hypothetical protein